MISLRIIFICCVINLVVVLQSQAQPNREENDLQRWNLKGKVKQQVTSLYVFEEKNGVQVKHYKQTDSIWFNRKGNLTRHVTSDSVGKLSYLQISSYDSSGRLPLREKFYDGPKKKKSSEHYCKYDNKGKCTLQVSIDWEERSGHRTLLFYNDKGLCEKKMYEYSDVIIPPRYKPSFQNKQLCFYDSSGRLQKEELYQSNGQFAWRINYLYDELGYLAIWKSNSEDSAITVYNKKGFKTSYGIYTRGNLISCDTTFYDANDKISTIKVYEYGTHLTTDLSWTYSDLDEWNNCGNIMMSSFGIPTQYREQKLFYYKK